MELDSKMTPARLSRRLVLASGTLLLGARDAAGGVAPQREGELTVISTSPRVLEGPFGRLEGFQTPLSRFFVRSHFAEPEIPPGEWRLHIEGEVRRPVSLTLADLRRLPMRKLSAVLECAGNGRSLLRPPVSGLQWGTGAVGCAEWEGVPLALLLERAGIRPGALEVIAEGADEGEPRVEPRPPGRLRFARSLPLSKAKADVLLAVRMNGEDLTRAHGYPVRLVVPGWYGMASVKWLTRLLVTPRAFQGYFQTVDYAVWQRRDGEAALAPVTEIGVKAQIARPVSGARIEPGRMTPITGAAWGGESPVRKVEVSTDGGSTWSDARLLDPEARHAWRRWEHPWRVPARPGRAILIARASDAAGRTQPRERDIDRRSYMINHWFPVEVRIG